MKAVLGAALIVSFLFVNLAEAAKLKGAAAEAVAQRAAAYVGSIDTLAATFDFVTVRGKTKGHLFVDRNRGSVRMQFGQPLGHLLLVNGPLTQFFGGDGTNVETATRGTPLEFILHPEKSLKTSIRVLEVVERGDRVYVTVAERGNEAGGQAILHFQSKPEWRLIDWGVYDSQGRYTQTVLGEPEIGLKLDPALFRAPE